MDELSPEISVLIHVSVALVQERDVSTLLRKVLDILDNEMGLARGTITLRQGRSEERRVGKECSKR